MDLGDLPLLDLIPTINPNYNRPDHLTPWCDLIERAANGEAVRGLCAVPIRHYKSETTEAGVIRILLKDPSTPVIFLTHSHDRAQTIGKRIRDLARAVQEMQTSDRERKPGRSPKRVRGGIAPMSGQDTISDWRNEAGGGVVIMSAEMSRLGYNCGCLIADDPLDENGANDPKIRESVDATIAHYTARCMRKGKPGPVLIVMSRWHPDDPVGRRLQRTARHWEYVHSAAILDEGLPTERAFAPNVWPLDELKMMRAELAEKDPTERLWWAQLQNEPRPMGAELFGPPTYYSKLPEWSYRKGFGIDMAYTVGDGADWFARVAGRVYGTKLYILDVTRHKIDAHLIESTCKADIGRYGLARFYSYMSGPEIGMAKVLKERGVPIARMKARYNKLVRAQRTIKRWNDGDILIPEGALWVPAFLNRLACFRGHEKDTDDDEVDALVSLADGELGGAVGATTTLGKSYGGFL